MAVADDQTTTDANTSETKPKSDVFLEARNVSISFPVPPHLALSGKDAGVGGRIEMIDGKKRLVAVDNVSFRLEAGDSLGLIGHNGSGKTTLLKILAGILQPSSGEVLYNGSLGNALNTNIGFRPERSGRYNIRLKSLIAGKKANDIPDIIDDIEEFAELGPFLDMPMRTYSAGMRARLAFGIATAFRYDILILDEWLGAGDEQFRRKATERLKLYILDAKILLLATHSRKLIRRVCKNSIYMRSGVVGAVDSKDWE